MPMIRKTIIVVLMLAASVSGTIGVLSGSGCTTWSRTLWSSGEFATAGSWDTLLTCAETRTVMVHHSEFLDAYAAPYQKSYRGLWWLYRRDVFLGEHSGLYIRSSILIVSFFIPILLALLFSLYPAALFIRGSLRRYRRRRLSLRGLRGLCLRCGYDLEGNVSGVCPECGTEIERR